VGGIKICQDIYFLTPALSSVHSDLVNYILKYPAIQLIWRKQIMQLLVVFLLAFKNTHRFPKDLRPLKCFHLKILYFLYILFSDQCNKLSATFIRKERLNLSIFSNLVCQKFLISLFLFWFPPPSVESDISSGGRKISENSRETISSERLSLQRYTDSPHNMWH